MGISGRVRRVDAERCVVVLATLYLRWGARWAPTRLPLTVVLSALAAAASWVDGKLRAVAARLSADTDTGDDGEPCDGGLVLMMKRGCSNGLLLGTVSLPLLYSSPGFGQLVATEPFDSGSSIGSDRMLRTSIASSASLLLFLCASGARMPHGADDRLLLHRWDHRAGQAGSGIDGARSEIPTRKRHRGAHAARGGDAGAYPTAASGSIANDHSPPSPTESLAGANMLILMRPWRGAATAAAAAVLVNGILLLSSPQLPSNSNDSIAFENELNRELAMGAVVPLATVALALAAIMGAPCGLSIGEAFVCAAALIDTVSATLSRMLTQGGSRGETTTSEADAIVMLGIMGAFTATVLATLAFRILYQYKYPNGIALARDASRRRAQNGASSRVAALTRVDGISATGINGTSLKMRSRIASLAAYGVLVALVAACLAASGPAWRMLMPDGGKGGGGFRVAHPVPWIICLVFDALPWVGSACGGATSAWNLGLVAYWLLLLASMLPVFRLIAGRAAIRGETTDSAPRSRILIRKLYHILSVLIFVPGFLAGPDLTKVAFACAFIVMAVLENVRMNTRSNGGARGRGYLFDDGVSEGMYRFFMAFTDDRDEGPVIVSHFSLLVGMAAPLWLSPSAFSGHPSVPAEGAGDSGSWMSWIAMDNLRSDVVDRSGHAHSATACVTAAVSILMPCAGLLSLGVLDTAGSFFGSITPRRFRIRYEFRLHYVCPLMYSQYWHWRFIRADAPLTTMRVRPSHVLFFVIFVFQNAHQAQRRQPEDCAGNARRLSGDLRRRSPAARAVDRRRQLRRTVNGSNHRV